MDVHLKIENKVSIQNSTGIQDTIKATCYLYVVKDWKTLELPTQLRWVRHLKFFDLQLKIKNEVSIQNSTGVHDVYWSYFLFLCCKIWCFTRVSYTTSHNLSFRIFRTAVQLKSKNEVWVWKSIGLHDNYWNYLTWICFSETLLVYTTLHNLSFQYFWRLVHLKIVSKVSSVKSTDVNDNY